MSKKDKTPNQSSSYSPNSIGGRLDELLRQKLMNINTPNQTNENPEKSVQGKGETQQPKKNPNGIRPTEDSKD